MQRAGRIMLGIVMVGLASGCRAAVQVREFPRTDLELASGGNRGYVVGTPPPAPQLRQNREMVELSAEVPTLFPGRYHARTQPPLALEQISPPEVDLETEEGEAPEAWSAPAQFDAYVVQKGDSLWSIAAKPEVFGKATRWRAIYDANRDLMRSPNDLHPGMKLRIPRGGEATQADEPRFVK